MSWEKPQWWIERRIRRRNPEPKSYPFIEYLNAFLTSLVALGTLAVGFATWRATERQADVAEALSALEYAKTQPRFEVSASDEVTPFRTGLSERSIALPRSISVRPVENVRELKLIDVPVTVSLYDSQGSFKCDIEIRGLYLDEGRGVANLWKASTADLEPFLMMLEAHGLNIFGSAPYVRLTFVDLFGQPLVKNYHLDGSEFIGAETGVPIYSGAWSNGQGFYTNQGLPERACPDAAELLHSAISDAGGLPGLPQ